MLRVAAITTVVLVVALPLAAQNLLVNPGFDDTDQLSGWTCITTYGLSTWSTDDRLASATSGSMQHDVSADSTNRSVFCRQCIPVLELHSYVASMWRYWPDDPDVTQDGSSRLSFGFFSDANCTTMIEWTPLAIAHYPPHPLGVWSHHPTLEHTAPAGALSARLDIVTWQDLANEPVRARIDDIDFHSTTIFRDDFESGNTNAWNP